MHSCTCTYTHIYYAMDVTKRNPGSSDGEEGRHTCLHAYMLVIDTDIHELWHMKDKEEAKERRMREKKARRASRSEIVQVCVLEV